MRVTICLTIDREVYCVFSVPCRERCVFTDISGLVREAEWREGDGGVFKSWSSPPDCPVLEGNTVPVGWGHRDAQGRVGDCHILLRTIHQFLPCYLDKEGWMTGYKHVSDLYPSYMWDTRLNIFPVKQLLCVVLWPLFIDMFDAEGL